MTSLRKLFDDAFYLSNGGGVKLGVKMMLHNVHGFIFWTILAAVQ